MMGVLTLDVLRLVARIVGRLLLWLWPLWFFLGLRNLAVGLFPNWPGRVVAVTLAPLLFLLWPWLQQRSGIVHPLHAWLAVIAAWLSAGLGLAGEIKRLSAWRVHYDWWALSAWIDPWQLGASLAAFIAGTIAAMHFAGFVPGGTNPWRLPGGSMPTRPTIRPARDGSHGTARLMPLAEAGKLLGDGDLIVGEARSAGDASWLAGARAGTAPLLRMPAKGHHLTIAGSGAGKTVSTVIPNLLEWPHALVCLDPKGECLALAGASRVVRRHRLVVLDPDARAGAANDVACGSLDVLALLDPARPIVVDEVRAVIAWLAGEPPGGQEAGYFHQAASDLLACLLLDLVCRPDGSNDGQGRREPPVLPDLRRRLADAALVTRLETIAASGPDLAFGAAADAARPLLAVAQGGDRQFAGILGTADSLTQWLASPRLSRLVSRPGIAPQEIVKGDIDVFLQLATHELDSSPGLARVVLGSLLHAVYRQARGSFVPKPAEEGPGGAAGSRPPVLFLLDEFPRLGRMSLMEVARDIGRGAGVILWPVCQDLGQLERIYGRPGRQSWLENAAVKQFFGVNDPDTADHVSRLIGETTVETRQQGRSLQPSFRQMTGGVSGNRGSSGRRLVTPDEVMRLAVDDDGVPDEQFLFLRNRPAIRCGLVKYHRRSEWRDRLGPPLPPAGRG